MKSIGNGLKRAQEARQRSAKENDFSYWEMKRWLALFDRHAQTSYELQQEAYMRDQAIRAISPEAMKAKAEREAMQNANPLRDILAEPHVVVPMDIANYIKSRQKPPPTLWQRIKRAVL
jgi:hypothetical protein